MSHLSNQKNVVRVRVCVVWAIVIGVDFTPKITCHVSRHWLHFYCMTVTKTKYLKMVKKKKTVNKYTVCTSAHLLESGCFLVCGF